MTLLIVLIIVAVFVATYLSSLNLALPGISRGALARGLESRGRGSDVEWLHDHLDAAILATALLRTLSRMAIYILVLAAMIGMKSQATVTWGSLIGSGLIAAAIIWFTTIVLGKSIARHFGVGMVAANFPILRLITVLCLPLTKAGISVDWLIQRLAGKRESSEAGSELLQSIEDTQREGTLDIQSAEILENVVEFTNTEVSQVMTVRSDIEAIEFTNDLSTIRKFIGHALHSRIPVFRGGIDNIVGILYLKDLIKYLGEDATDFRLAPLLRQPIVVPETKPVRELLSVFQRSEVHLAIVIDEYGGTAGLVTIENVLEEIVGEIRDEHEHEDDQEPVLRTIDDTHAEVDGRFRIDELNAKLRLNLPEDQDYDTIAGFVLAQLGHVPRIGEIVEVGRSRFTALIATPTSLKRVGIELLPEQQPDQAPEPSNAAEA